jgi:hypothetical protein
MARQLAEIYNGTPSDDDETREWINWLGSYVIGLPETSESGGDEERYTVPAAADLSVEARGDGDDATPEAAVVQGIRLHGDAFRAFLQLDARRDAKEPLHSFNQCYLGAYVSMDDLPHELTPIRECEEVVAYVTRVLGLDGLVTLDWNGVERVVREKWDIVSYGDKLYVFTKQKS